MGAGELVQLVNKSNIDQYINVNPDISYFKFAYSRHTNFALTSIRLDFNTLPTFNDKGYKFRCPIIKNDYNILSDLHFRYKIPDIYSSDKHKFKWVPNYGTLMIKRAELIINNSIIDTITGEWLVISSEFTEVIKDNYNKLTGNISSLFDPKMDIPIITINNNRYKNAYPIGDKLSNKPSIRGREIIVPLSFCFTKNPSLGILLSKLTGITDTANNIWIELTLEDIENLYQVYSDDLNMYISPKYYNDLYPNNKISIDTFVINKDIASYIEASCIMLDNNELANFASLPIVDILIDKLVIGNDNSIIPGEDKNTTITLMGANTHIKEIIWTLKRDDYYKFNTHTNYTNSIPENLDNPIMTKAKIVFNKGIEKIEKDSNYYNLIEPYKYHSAIPKQGIYCYSFSLYPERYKPSGSLSSAEIETALHVYVNNQDNSSINGKLRNLNKEPYNYNYTLSYYIRTINILRYINGNVSYAYVN